MVEAAPSPSFEMSQPDLLLEFLIVAFDPPSQLGNVDATGGLRLDAKDRERLNSGVQSVLVKEMFPPPVRRSSNRPWRERFRADVMFGRWGPDCLAGHVGPVTGGACRVALCGASCGLCSGLMIALARQVGREDQFCCSYPNKPRTTAAQKTTPTPTKQKAAIRSLHAVCFATRSVSVKAVSSPRPESRASTKILLIDRPPESPLPPW